MGTPPNLKVKLYVELPCRLFDPDLWFAERPVDLEVAKSLCAVCPVCADCLAGAIERAESWGVWGGEIFEEGVILERKRPRGRPRKDVVATEEAMRVEVATRTQMLLASRRAA